MRKNTKPRHILQHAIIKTHPSGGISINDFAITGEATGSPLEEILRNLRVTRRMLAGLKSKKILSLGEGHSRLLPFLLQNGLDAKALDLWYHRTDIPDTGNGSLLNAYNKTYNGHLVAGSALDMPFEDASFDAIFSHMLINNIAGDDREKFTRNLETMLGETIRVLKPGGRARLAALGFDEDIQRARTKLDSYGSNVRHVFQRTIWQFNDNDRPGYFMRHPMQLLVIDKLKSL